MPELNLKETYLVDGEGRRIGVVLSMSAYQELMNQLQELEAYRSANDVNLGDSFFASQTIRGSSVSSMPIRRGPGGMVVI